MALSKLLQNVASPFTGAAPCTFLLSPIPGGEALGLLVRVNWDPVGERKEAGWIQIKGISHSEFHMGTLR